MYEGSIAREAMWTTPFMPMMILRVIRFVLRVRGRDHPYRIL